MSFIHPMQTIQQQIDNIKNNKLLADGNITILAASKGQSEARISQAIAAGIVHFGENRVQEAESKWPALRQAHPQIRLHLIGPLQTNKVKQALELFDVIQTIDRPKLAETVAKLLPSPHLPQHSKLKTQHFYIQVNIGKEPQKAGVMPDDVDALVKYCRDDLHLAVSGLMCIPPNDHPPAPYFALLREMARRNNLSELSMGMSDDYETAVRMGRVLFGEREAEHYG